MGSKSLRSRRKEQQRKFKEAHRSNLHRVVTLGYSASSRSPELPTQSVAKMRRGGPFLQYICNGGVPSQKWKGVELRDHLHHLEDPGLIASTKFGEH